MNMNAALQAKHGALTAFVPTPLWRGGKKNASTWRRVQQRLKEEKRSRCFERTLLIKDFRYMSSLSIFVRKNKRRNGRKVSQFFTLTNNTTAEFDSGSKFKEQRAEIPYRACFVIFQGAQNIAGESSLKNTMAQRLLTKHDCLAG